MCSGRVSDSESRGPVVNPQWWHLGRCVVFLSKTEYWLKPRKQLLHPSVTEKLLTGTFNLNTCTNKQII